MELGEGRKKKKEKRMHVAKIVIPKEIKFWALGEKKS